MNVAIQITASLAILMEPFLPETSIRLKKMMNLQEITWESLGENNNSEGHQINKAEHLFSRLEDKIVAEQREKLQKAKEASEANSREIEPQKESTTFDEFQKIDLRVGTIIEAEKIKKAKKLLKIKKKNFIVQIKNKRQLDRLIKKIYNVRHVDKVERIGK